jgi:hypothetical protein
MLCTNGRSICSGCAIEMAKHRKFFSLEKELLQLSIANQYLAPLLEYRSKVITIKEFRKILSCLPTFERDIRDDSIFEAARYMANTLGIKVYNSPSSSLIDTPMTDTETRQMWRKASFFCRCQGNITTSTFEVRSFCNSCSCLIPFTTTLSTKICIGCNINEKWEHVWSPCLACQFASIVFRYPFANRFQILIDTWLPLPSDHESSSLESSTEEIQLSRQDTKAYDTLSIERKNLIRLRCRSINESLDTIQSRSSVKQNCYIFENLISLKKKVVEEISSRTTSCDHQHNIDLSIDTQEYNLNISENEQNKKVFNILHENSNGVQNHLASIGDSQKTCKPKQVNIEPSSPLLRSPMMTLQMNCNDSFTSKRWPVGSKNQQRRHIRTLEKKENKKRRVQGFLQVPQKNL